MHTAYNATPTLRGGKKRWERDDPPEYDEADAGLIQQLKAQFPDANDKDIRSALASRNASDRLRRKTIQRDQGLKWPYDETPAVMLQREHPGFSDTVYTNAENFGYYLIR